MAAGSKERAPEVELARLEARFREEPGMQDFHLLADAFTRLGRFSDAIMVCKTGLRKHPDAVGGHVALGRALFGAGNLVKAGKVLRRAIRLKEPGSEAFRLLAEILLRRATPGEAVSVLEEAVRKGIAKPPLLRLLQRARTEHEHQVQETRSASSIRPLWGGPGHGRAWEDISSAWEQQLDAHRTRPMTMGQGELHTPTPGLRPVRVALGPLVDPLAEGMPPLPADEAERGPTPLPETVEQGPLTLLQRPDPDPLQRTSEPGATDRARRGSLDEGYSHDEVSGPTAPFVRVPLQDLFSPGAQGGKAPGDQVKGGEPKEVQLARQVPDLRPPEAPSNSNLEPDRTEVLVESMVRSKRWSGSQTGLLVLGLAIASALIIGVIAALGWWL